MMYMEDYTQQVRSKPHYINVGYSQTDSQGFQYSVDEIRVPSLSITSELEEMEHTQNDYQQQHNNGDQSNSHNASSDRISEAHTDSDTTRIEREHYNKLKVSSRTKSITAASNLSRFEEQTTSKFYKQEGHTNQLHSVTSEIISRSLPALTTPISLMLKSKSTGNMKSLQDIPTGIAPSHSTYSLTKQDNKSTDHLAHPLHRSEESDASSYPCNDLPFMRKMIIFTCNWEGKEITSSSYEFTINIPKGAVRKRKTMQFQVGVCMQGPFAIPKGYRPVSPIVSVRSKMPTKLKKPTEIAITHCIDQSEQMNRNLTFFRASEKATSLGKYQFQPTDINNNQFEVHSNNGKITTTEMGFFCIMVKESTDQRQRSNYCLIPIVPRHVDSTSWTIHYCIVYQLKAFIEVIEEKFGSSWNVLPPKKFKLGTRVGHRQQEKIEVHFNEKPSEVGWLLSLESERKIHTHDIDSWCTIWMGENNTEPHPALFTIRVHGDYASSAAAATVWFTGPGMPQDLITETVLPFKGIPISASHSPSMSSFSSTSIPMSSPYGSIIQDSSSDYDHIPSQEETHTKLTYRNGQIDLLTDEDLHRVASEVSRAMSNDWIRLQTPLEIPHHIMLDIRNQKTVEQQVYRLFKEWRQHAKDNSKEKLARCLRSTDVCLHTAADILLD